MTITTYYATCRPNRRNSEADAIVHLINDQCAVSGDNRSWDSTWAQVDAVADAATQRRLGLVVEAEQHEHHAEDE
ncbi:MAG TPA: hypothetical protein VMC81_04545 [Rhodocyclaceae bacterium]|nr:hypothetical protein [Rhodocyclaceae bacterium]HVO22136.1 hypothetical protein [Candidatus Margulisiibacteriota bacterium]